MKKTILLIILAVIAIIVSNKNEYIEIPSTSIRMRVIAKSNDIKDQRDKTIIKSVIEEKLYELIDGVEDYSKIDEIIEDNKNELDEIIENTLNRHDIKSTFTANYGYNYFPEKEFKGLTYEAGNYKSYVVTLGEGEGENWWCVLYPPICLIDENVDDYEYHSLIKDTLEKYN